MKFKSLSIFLLCLSIHSFATEKQEEIQTNSPIPRIGCYIGAGFGFDMTQAIQKNWGQGIVTLYVDSTPQSAGNAQGSGTPFYQSTPTFSPEVQTGFYNYIGKTDYFYGLKFLYTYLGLKTTDYELYIPQQGEITNLQTHTSSPLFGYVVTQAVQTKNNHELAFLAYFGKEIKKAQFYLGVGPALFSTKSRNYDSIGYAVIGPDTINLTGLVNYSTPSLWTWGGAAQLGVSYFPTPGWFLDFSYTYATSGNHAVFHEQPFSNIFGFGDSSYVQAQGIIKTKNTMRIISQSFIISINKLISW